MKYFKGGIEFWLSDGSDSDQVATKLMHGLYAKQLSKITPKELFGWYDLIQIKHQVNKALIEGGRPKLNAGTLPENEWINLNTIQGRGGSNP